MEVDFQNNFFIAFHFEEFPSHSVNGIFSEHIRCDSLVERSFSNVEFGLCLQLSTNAIHSNASRFHTYLMYSQSNPKWQ